MANVHMDVYEDMFKEITKKIYGHDRSSSSKNKQLAEQDKYQIVEEGLSVIENNETATAAESFGEQEQPKEDPWVTSDETISWTTSKISSYNADRKLFKCQECESVGLLSSVAEHWLGTHADVKVFQCPQCPYASAWARCIRTHMSRQHNVVAANGLKEQQTAGRSPWKESPVLEEVTSYLGRLKAAADKALADKNAAVVSNAVADAAAYAIDSDDEMQISAADTETQTAQKRYNCSYCPYGTDRRDLHIRHENIHKDNKPFMCDVCQKQFNRADHVKKHYTRMHREYEYCLSRVKRDLYGNVGIQRKHPRVTLYSGDPSSMIEPEPQIIVSQTTDVQPLTSAPIISATPIILQDDQQQQQQQTVVNIAVVNFNEQTGTHTIQIPISTSQLKPVMFAPETILTVDPTAMMSTDAPAASIIQTDAPAPAMMPTDVPAVAMMPTEAPAAAMVLTDAPATSMVLTDAPATTMVLTDAPATTMMLTDSPATSMVLTDAPATSMVLTDAPATTMMLTDSPATSMVMTDAPATTMMLTDSSATTMMLTDSPATTMVLTDAPATTMMLTDSPATAMVLTDAPATTMMLTDAPAATMIPTDASTTEATAAAATAAEVMATEAQCKNNDRRNFRKRYSCTYCSWSGMDNWCLKRHLNTHMKPYECIFCEYKAARAERLATHVLKVHSKKMCSRCSYIAQDYDDLYAHQSENNHKSVRSRRTQTSPTPSSPEQTEDNNSEKNDMIVGWPISNAETQNSIHM
ncbi:Zinc finger C2H2-type,Zinc finger, RING/FYVE/PHD-type [Cinara cedri]|uniref:Zinc finger C2H2-type,Zinc finger, RING/FYVE/PHD-type n=1 Tax=Cinara cedri TaxID=506608 RepID=A0A5E4M474_9HEMI|nr:Zinc finger C2H2-type,Zinc finger, RING/FYVE/PHD-type [Cinara cedri]